MPRLSSLRVTIMFNLSPKHDFYFEASFFTFMLVYLAFIWDKVTTTEKGFTIALLTYMFLNTIQAWRQWNKEKP